MKKEDLMKLEGMTEDLATKIAEVSAEELKGYIPKTRFDEVNEAKKNAEALVKERDRQLEEVKKASGDNEDLAAQIVKLQEENKLAQEKYQSDLRQMQVSGAVQLALKDAGAKNITALTALLKDLDKAELAEDGTIKGLAEQIKELKKTDAYLFENTEGQQAKPSGATPAGNSTKPGTESTWASRLAEARKNGNTTEAIAIKNEAFKTDGVVLM